MSEHLAYGEDGKLVPVEEFDYETVDRDLFRVEDTEDLAGISAAELEVATKMFGTVLGWVWQNGMRNTQGLQIRSAIVCWVFLKELRPLSLTDIATGFGMDKQSIGRWHDDFKRRFPAIKTVHMRPTAPEIPRSKHQSPNSNAGSNGGSLALDHALNLDLSGRPEGESKIKSKSMSKREGGIK